MTPKTLTAGLLVAGCLTAAGSGAYLAVRQNRAEYPPADAATVAGPADAPAASQPVSETEAVVGTIQAPPTAELEAKPEAPPSPATARVEQPAAQPAPARRPSSTNEDRVASARARERRERLESPTPAAPPPPPAAAEREAPAAVPIEPPADTSRAPASTVETPQIEEVVLPASSVIGVQVETPLSSERSRVEDRVEARVTREVTAAGRTAIPAGSRMIGNVTVVEKGGKIKERARLGIRFHTLVLADGREVPLRTEPIYREGEPPSGDSSRKIGGAAVGGAILGAILGGGKGAAIGGAAGAAGGTAVVMAGDRNAATLPAGTVVTVRLAAPATIEIERR